MLKARAIELLGGTIASAAKEVGISYQAVDKWPDMLPSRIADRVLAAYARRHLPGVMDGIDEGRTVDDKPLELVDRRERPEPIDFPDRRRPATQGGF